MAPASSTPVSVTVWAVSQLALVKVRLAGETETSVVSPLLMGITTSAVGFVSSTTVNVSVVAASVVVRPLVGLTVIPATSLSVLVTVTLLTAMPS